MLVSVTKCLAPNPNPVNFFSVPKEKAMILIDPINRLGLKASILLYTGIISSRIFSIFSSNVTLGFYGLQRKLSTPFP